VGHGDRTLVARACFSLSSRVCRAAAKNIKLILYPVREAPIYIRAAAFCRDNRAILNRHEAGNFFSRARFAERPPPPPLPRATRGTLKYQSQYFQISDV